MTDGFPGVSSEMIPGSQAAMEPSQWQYEAIVIRGLPGVGKTTLANEIVLVINDMHNSKKAFHVNADVIRSGVSAGLGFSPEDRIENARRIGCIARIAQLNGHLPVVDFVMPTRETCDAFRVGFGSDMFKLFSLNGDPKFVSRFKDTAAIFEPLEELITIWPLSVPYGVRLRHFDVPYYTPVELHHQAAFIVNKAITP